MHILLLRLSYLYEVRPKLVHGSTLYVSEILDQLDHLLNTASVEENTPLQTMEVELELVLVRLVQGTSFSAKLTEEMRCSLCTPLRLVCSVGLLFGCMV